MTSNNVGTATKILGAVVTLATLVWAHGSWVSSVNLTLAETGKAMAGVSSSVGKNTDKLMSVETTLVSVRSDVLSVSADTVRIEALTGELSRHVGDLREVTAELKVLVRRINRKEKWK